MVLVDGEVVVLVVVVVLVSGAVVVLVVVLVDGEVVVLVVVDVVGGSVVDVVVEVVVVAPAALHTICTVVMQLKSTPLNTISFVPTGIV